jgi:selenocysteine-specific elongation factor
MPREELRSRLQERFPGLSGRLFNQLVARAAHHEIVAENEASVWLADHDIEFAPDQRQQIDALLARFQQAPYTTPSVSECVSSLGEDVFEALLEEGTLVRLSDDVVYLSETFIKMQSRVVDHLRREGQITVAQVRDMFGASRKYALALMEALDERRVTRRVGDARVLR